MDEVLCIRARGDLNGRIYWVPVLDKPHIDEPELGEDGTALHWHLDYRYMTYDELSAFKFNCQNPPGIKLPEPCTMDNYLEILSLRTENRCRLRDFNHVVWRRNANRYKFESKYTGKAAILYKCPHRGFNVTAGRTVTINGEQHWLCPGHGLCISKSTITVKLTCK